MVVLNVTYKCKPGMREDFLKAIRAEGLDAPAVPAIGAVTCALHGYWPPAAYRKGDTV